MRLMLVTTIVLGSAGAVPAQNTSNVVFSNRTASSITSDGMDTRRVLFADVDGDLDDDLLTLNYDQPNGLYENMGLGVFTEVVDPTNDLLAASRAKGADFGDVDGDGDLDAFVANGKAAANDLLVNQGGVQLGVEGHFLRDGTSVVSTDVAPSYAGALADLDGDADLDLVVANRYAPNVRYENTGGGVFAPVTSGPIPAAESFGSRDVEIADLDNDGDLEVVVANSTGESNYVYVNRGNAQGAVEGTFVRLLNDPFHTDGGRSYGVTAGDLDADGLADLVVSNRNQVNFLYENVTVGGQIAFQRVLTGPFDPAVAPTSDSYAAALGDVEGDGDVDVVFANRATSNAFFLAKGASGFEYQRVTDGQIVSDVADSRDVVLRDVTGDGALEAMVANTLGGDNALYDNLGPMWSDEGSSLAGTSGPPRLSGHGPLVPNGSILLMTQDALANAPAVFVIGVGTIFAPFRGGTIVPSLDILVSGLSTNGVGQLPIPLTFPTGVPTGVSLYFQMLIVDGGAPFGVAFSNGLRGMTL